MNLSESYKKRLSQLAGISANKNIIQKNESKKNVQVKSFENIELNTLDVLEMIDYADSYKNLYPGYSEYDNEYEEDYYFASKEAAYEDINNVLEFFNSLPNPIPIYRSIKVNSMDDVKYEWLGDSWSFDRQSAINFANNQAGGNVLLSGKVNFDNVDWKNTLKLNYQFSRGNDDYDENEINIIDSEKVFDVKTEKIRR